MAACKIGLIFASKQLTASIFCHFSLKNMAGYCLLDIQM